MNGKALFDISYGLYVVGATYEGKTNGQIANTVFQITSEPKTIAVSINKQNFTHTLIENSERFSISVLTQETPMELIGLFGFQTGKSVDKFCKVSHNSALEGTPVLSDYCKSYMELRVVQRLDMGTHTLFVGEMVDAQVCGEGDLLTYAYYHEVKKGTAPKTAPTYREAEVPADKKQESPMTNHPEEQPAKYKCAVCGYEYDSLSGDPVSKIAPGTDFEDLPNHWQCPVCTADKELFIKI